MEADIERLQEAVGLYRGDFLEGFYVRRASAFEAWILAQLNAVYGRLKVQFKPVTIAPGRKRLAGREGPPPPGVLVRACPGAIGAALK